MQQSIYHIRVMRPTYERAIVTVEASSEEAAMQAALQEAGRLTDEQWALQGAEREEPVVEIALPEEEAEGSDADVLGYLIDAQYAYALLQADLAEASGSFIAPTWLRRQPGLAVPAVSCRARLVVSHVAGRAPHRELIAWDVHGPRFARTFDPGLLFDLGGALSCRLL